jgi:IS30 family transposase
MKLPHNPYTEVYHELLPSLTTFERGRLETLQKLGWSTRQIAKELNRHHSTIARELKRNRTKEYVSEVAHERYVERRKGCKPKGK